MSKNIQVRFNKPCQTGTEEHYIAEAIQGQNLAGNGPFAQRCQGWLQNRLGVPAAYLTPSCTAALEMAAILINIKPGDEVIMPSYTFVSTANAFVLRGARIVFVDIHPSTMNLDENLIEKAINSKTKAIVAVHYAGVACNLQQLTKIANSHNLYLIEDAAQGIMAKYAGQHLGTWGHVSTFSFHETKNITSGGEGGAIIINDIDMLDKASIIREKGTNRSRFLLGYIDKYSWVNIGSSFLPSEIQAAYLWAQFNHADDITNARRVVWQKYLEAMTPLADSREIELPSPPPDCLHNGHIFFIKVRNLNERTAILDFLHQHGVGATFHYVPLHSSVAGKVFGHFSGDDTFTTRESDRLVRLPIYHNISDSDVEHVIECVYRFFKKARKH